MAPNEMQIYTALRKHSGLKRFRFATLVNDELRGDAQRLPQSMRDMYHLVEAFGWPAVFKAALAVARLYGGNTPPKRT